MDPAFHEVFQQREEDLKKRMREYVASELPEFLDQKHLLLLRKVVLASINELPTGLARKELFDLYNTLGRAVITEPRYSKLEEFIVDGKTIEFGTTVVEGEKYIYFDPQTGDSVMLPVGLVTSRLLGHLMEINDNNRPISSRQSLKSDSD